MPYRSDEDAVEARRLDIERELGDVKSRVDQFEYLRWRQKELEAELAAIARTKASFARTRLPMLASAKIASPCSADWEKMVGGDHVRFCGSCEKNVYNLSALTTADAEALFREKGGDLCARLYRRKDGTILTADCPVGVRKKWVMRAAGAAVLLGSAAAAGVALSRSRQPVLAAQAQAMGGRMATVNVPVQNAQGQTGNLPNPGMAGADEGLTAPPVTPTTPCDTPHMKGGKHDKVPTYTLGRMAPLTNRDRD